VEVDSSRVHREDNVPQSEFFLAAELDEDCGMTMDVSFVYVQLLQSIEKDDIGWKVVVNEYPLDLAVGYELWND